MYTYVLAYTKRAAWVHTQGLTFLVQAETVMSTFEFQFPFETGNLRVFVLL